MKTQEMRAVSNISYLDQYPTYEDENRTAFDMFDSVTKNRPGARVAVTTIARQFDTTEYVVMRACATHGGLDPRADDQAVHDAVRAVLAEQRRVVA